MKDQIVIKRYTIYLKTKLFVTNHIGRLFTSKIENLCYYKIYKRTIKNITKGQLKVTSK